MTLDFSNYLVWACIVVSRFPITLDFSPSVRSFKLFDHFVIINFMNSDTIFTSASESPRNMGINCYFYAKTVIKNKILKTVNKNG